MEVNSWLGVAGAINMGVKADGHEEQPLSVLSGPFIHYHVELWQWAQSCAVKTNDRQIMGYFGQIKKCKD